MFCSRIVVITLSGLYKHLLSTLPFIPHGAAVAAGGQWREEGRMRKRSEKSIVIS